MRCVYPPKLEAANIPVSEHEFLRSKGEVPSAIIGILDGWTFRRAWYYWIAQSDKSVLLFQYADPLHEKHGQQVRVDGHCACPSPREWNKEQWSIGVNLYHINSQEGLIALADAIRTQTASNTAWSRLVEGTANLPAVVNKSEGELPA